MSSSRTYNWKSTANWLQNHSGDKRGFSQSSTDREEAEPTPPKPEFMENGEFEDRLRRKSLEILRLTNKLKRKDADLRQAKSKLVLARQKHLRLKSQNRESKSDFAVLESLKSHYLQLYQQEIDKVKSLQRSVKTLKRKNTEKIRERDLIKFKNQEKLVKKSDEIRRLMESCHSLRDELQLKTEENLRLTKEAEEVKSQLQHQHNQVKSALNLELTCVICSELMIEAVVSGECGHSFCKRCIQEWIRRKPECPICRARCYRTAPAHVVQQLHERLLGCVDIELRTKYAEAVELRKTEQPIVEDPTDHSDVEILIENVYNSALNELRRARPHLPINIIPDNYSSDDDYDRFDLWSHHSHSPSPHYEAPQPADNHPESPVYQFNPDWFRELSDVDDNMSSSSRSHRAAAILDAIDDDLQLRYYSASDSESHLRDRGAEPEEDGYQPSYFSPTRFSDDAAYERRPTPIPESDAEDLAFDMDILHRLNESNQPSTSYSPAPPATWWEQMSTERRGNNRRSLVPFHKRKSSANNIRYSTSSEDSD